VLRTTEELFEKVAYLKHFSGPSESEVPKGRLASGSKRDDSLGRMGRAGTICEWDANAMYYK
jgi:hypothetical protein